MPAAIVLRNGMCAIKITSARTLRLMFHIMIKISGLLSLA